MIKIRYSYYSGSDWAHDNKFEFFLKKIDTYLKQKTCSYLNYNNSQYYIIRSQKDIIFAASASPSACKIFCWRSCLARSTKNTALCASWWATCFASTAAVYSLPKLSSVIDTSSKIMLKSRARSTSCFLMSSETC